MKTIITVVIVGIVATAGMYYGQDIVQMFENEPVRVQATSTPMQVEVSSDVEKARKQLEEATTRLSAEEAKILADTEQASSTAHAQVATIMAEYEAKKAENDAKLDEINEIRSSF